MRVWEGGGRREGARHARFEQMEEWEDDCIYLDSDICAGGLVPGPVHSAHATRPHALPRKYKPISLSISRLAQPNKTPAVKINLRI